MVSEKGSRRHRRELSRRHRPRRETENGIIKYLCIVVVASTLSLTVLTIGVYVDTSLEATSIRENRKQELLKDMDIQKLMNDRNRQYYSIAKFRRPTLGGIKESIVGKYLVPVLPFDVGPNNLFRHFKEAIPIAKMMNLTLVIPPFHRHPRMEIFVNPGENADPDEKYIPKVKVPIFDTDYTVEIETNPEHTVDFDLLRSFHPAIPYSEFELACGKTIETLIECGDIDPKRHQGFKYFNAATGVKVAHRMNVAHFHPTHELSRNMYNLARKIELHESNCIGLAIGKKCLGDRERYMKLWKEYGPYVRRPHDIQTTAIEFFRDAFHGETFAGIHWRYDKYDWNDMCKESRPEAAKARNGQICEYAELLIDGDERLLEKMTSNLKSRLKDLDINHGYITGPPQINNTMAAFRRKIPSLRTVDDLRHWVRTKLPEKSYLLDTNYLLSHLEQEIMYLSTKFIGSPLSSWTQTVFFDRMAVDITDDESILDICLPGVEDLPKLTWLFPEGDL